MSPVCKIALLGVIAAICATAANRIRNDTGADARAGERAVYAAIMSKLHTLCEATPAQAGTMKSVEEVQQAISDIAHEQRPPIPARASLDRIEFGATRVSHTTAEVEVILFGNGFVRPLLVELHADGGEWKIRRVRGEHLPPSLSAVGGLRL